MDHDSCRVILGAELGGVASDRLGFDALPWHITAKVVAGNVDARKEAVFVETVSGPCSCVEDAPCTLDFVQLSLVVNCIGSVERMGVRNVGYHVVRIREERFIQGAGLP